MGNPYPTTYRTAAARQMGDSFQRSPSSFVQPSFGDYKSLSDWARTTPFRPASNDAEALRYRDSRGFGAPLPKLPVPPAYRPFPSPPAFGVAFKFAAKLIPYIRIASIAWDLINWWRYSDELTISDMTGWITFCGSASGAVYAGALTPCGPWPPITVAGYNSAIGHTAWSPPVETCSFVKLNVYDPANNFVQFDVIGAFGRLIASPIEWPYPVRAPDPEPLPAPMPRWRRRPDPYELPNEAPIPYEVIPDRIPDQSSDGSDFGYAPSPVGVPSPHPRPIPFIPNIGIRWTPTTGTQVDIIPRSGADPRGGSGEIVPTPGIVAPPKKSGPDPKVERKVKSVTTGGNWARVQFDGLTEGKDFWEALWDALPKKYQTKTDEMRRQEQAARASGMWKPRYRKIKPPLHKMIQDVASNWDKLDIAKAMTNIVKNEIGDRAWGKIGKELGKAGARAGRPVGFGQGPAF